MDDNLSVTSVTERINSMEENIALLTQLVAKLTSQEASVSPIPAPLQPRQQEMVSTSDDFQTLLESLPTDFAPGASERSTFKASLPGTKEAWVRLIIEYHRHVEKNPLCASLAATLAPHVGTLAILPHLANLRSLVASAQGLETYCVPQHEVGYIEARDAINKATSHAISAACVPNDMTVKEAWFLKFTDAVKPKGAVTSTVLATYLHRVTLLVDVLHLASDYSDKAISAVVKSTLPATQRAVWGRIARAGLRKYPEILGEMIRQEANLEEARLLLETRTRLIEDTDTDSAPSINTPARQTKTPSAPIPANPTKFVPVGTAQTTNASGSAPRSAKPDGTGNTSIVADLTDESNCPGEGFIWCPNHKKWGKHTVEKCYLGANRGHCNAIGAHHDPVEVTVVVDGQPHTMKAIADNCSQRTYMRLSDWEMLARDRFVTKRPSRHVMVAANNTETNAAFDVLIDITHNRPGRTPAAITRTSVVHVMEDLNVPLILSQEVSTYLGFFDPATVTLGTPGAEDNNTDPLAVVDSSPDALIKESIANASPDVKADLYPLLCEHKELFLPPGDTPADVRPMKVTLKDDAVPKAARPYNMSPPLRAEADRVISDLLERDIIERSSSNWGSPIFFVHQKTKERMVIDYTTLNAHTVPEPVPLSSCDTLLRQVAGAKYFASIDLRSGYHQIALDEESRPLTSFVCHLGQFHFKRIPFGLMNAPGHFQKALLEVLDDLVRVGCVILYIDDMLVVGKTPSEFLTNVRGLLDRLMKHGLRLSGDKCRFGQKEVRFLGHVISGDHIAIDPDRKLAIAEMITPRSLTALRGTLGVFNYCRAFVPRYTEVTRPLLALLKDTPVPFKLTDEAEEAFNDVKHILQHAPVLSHPDYNHPLILQTDASGYGLGAVLLQRINGEIKFISFFSRALSETQRSWSITEKEAAALYEGVLRFDCFLRGVTFVAEVDHKNLTFLTSSKSEKVRRWKNRLAEYPFTIKYITGASNDLADALSRLFQPDIGTCHSIVTADRMPCDTDAERLAVFKAVHGNSAAGHLGVNATRRVLTQRGYAWAGMDTQLATFIASCPVCQKYRLKKTVSVALGHLVTDIPFHTVSVDSIGPLPADESTGACHVLVLTDNFTRWTELVPLDSVTAFGAAQALIERVYARHGLPYYLHSDNGSQFVNQLIAGLNRCLHIEHTTIYPYVSRQNGIVERANAEVRKHLKTLLPTLGKRWSDWVSCLPLAQFVMNNAHHRVIGTTPHAMLYGDILEPRNNMLPRLLTADLDGFEPIDGYTHQLKARLEAIHAEARKTQSAELRYDGPESTTFNENDLVLLAPMKGPRSKTAPNFRGPYRVAERLGRDYYRIESLYSDQAIKAHACRLRQFHADNRSLEELTDVARGDEDDELFVVESVVSHERRDDGFVVFRLRWAGYEPDEDTYQTYDAALEGNESVEAYIDAHHLRDSLLGKDGGVVTHDL